MRPHLSTLAALTVLAAAGAAAAQGAGAPAAPAPLPPGYSVFGAMPPLGPSPGLKAQAFDPQAVKVYKLSFRAGDDIMGGMYRFARSHPMTQAALSGVGGVSGAVLSWYDPKVKALKRVEVNEKCEITGIAGTITTNAKGEPNVHLHMVLARSDGSSVSGHLISGTVDPILEIFVTDLGAGKDVAVP